MNPIIARLNQSAKARGIDLEAVRVTETAKLNPPEDKICAWLNDLMKLEVRDLSSVKAVREHLSGVFKIHQTLREKANAIIVAKEEQLKLEGSIPLVERLINGELKVPLEQIGNALSTCNKENLTFGKDLDIREQRLHLFQLAVSVQSKLKDGEKLEDALAAAIRGSSTKFTKEGLAALNNEAAREVILMDGTQTINKSLGRMTIVLAGKDAVIEGKNDPLYGLASTREIKYSTQIQDIKADELPGITKTAIQKLDAFWDQDSTKTLLAKHEVKIEKGEDGLQIKAEHLEGPAANAFNHELAEHMVIYINNEPVSKITDQEKAVIVELSKRSADIVQEGGSLSKMISGLLGGINLGSLLSSGMFGLLAGGLMNPWIGIAVAIASALLNGSGQDSTNTATKTASTSVARQAPPAPTTTQTSSPVAAVVTQVSAPPAKDPAATTATTITKGATTQKSTTTTGAPPVAADPKTTAPVAA